MQKYLELVKFSHTLFALPFALIAMLIASEGLPPLRVVAWILAAMVAARTMAMTFNRIVDLDYDRENPRAQNRPTVTGEVSETSAWILWGVTSTIFFFSAWMLNATCLSLSPIVWAVLNGYSFGKRFTRWPHLLLGLALGMAPLGAWVAVTGRLEWAPLPLAGAVLLWVAGFDIIYSLQDEEVDKRLGIYSLVTGFGPAKALLLSRLFHAVTVALLLWFGANLNMGTVYFIGVATVAVALLVEQSMVSPEDRSRIGVAFFTANGFVSLALLVATALDIYLR